MFGVAPPGRHLCQALTPSRPGTLIGFSIQVGAVQPARGEPERRGGQLPTIMTFAALPCDCSRLARRPLAGPGPPAESDGGVCSRGADFAGVNLNLKFKLNQPQAVAWSLLMRR
jgi:hypothetical protein